MSKGILKVKQPTSMVDNYYEDEDFSKELDKISLVAISESEQTRVIKNIRKTLASALKKKYGFSNGQLKELTTKILKIHGLDDSNFDTLKQFEQFLLERTNDVSIDDNSNKNEKTVAGLLNEVNSSNNKLIGYHLLYNVMKEMYGQPEAKILSGDLYDLSLGLSDSTKITIPYSYYGNTPIIAKINGEVKYITLKKLFNMFEDESQPYEDSLWVDTTNLQKEFTIQPAVLKGRYGYHNVQHTTSLNELPSEKIHIQVWDTKNGWVDVSRIVKHPNKKDFVLYQVENGDFAFVTEDHPVYMADGSEKLAGDLVKGDEVLKDEDMSIPQVAQTFVVPDNLAYFTGFVLGDGTVQSYDKDLISNDRKNMTGITYTRGGNLITLYQNDIHNSYIKQLTDKLFDNPNYFKVTEKSDRSLNFTSYDYTFLASVLFDYDCKENSFTKHLPTNIMSWTTSSKEAFVAGLIDFDGTTFPNELNRVSIRLMSYATINGLADVLKGMDGIHAVRKRIDGTNIDHCIYEVSFKVTKESRLIELSQKLKDGFEKSPETFEQYSVKLSTTPHTMKVSKIIRFNDSDVKETRFLKAEIQDVYDITTATGRFYANGMVQHNCWALDASRLVIEGRKFGQLPSKPAKRVDSYIAALNETVHQMSSHLAGAIAVGTFFLDIAHLMIFKERVPFEKLKHDKELRKMVENNYQKFVHSVNHLSRNGIESPFTNISLFDRVKLKYLIGDQNYGWYFPNKKEVAYDNGLEEKMSAEDWESYVVNYVLELQDIYTAFHEKGDPMNNGIPYRFPVTTINYSKTEDNEIEDEEFLHDTCKLDISRFNIFTSKGTKVASCCRLINDAELLDLGAQVNSFGGSSISMGSHRVCTINFARIAYEADSLKEFYKILDIRIKNTAKILKAHKVLLGMLERKGLEPFITRGWIRMDRLFSTYGILGVVECKKILETKFPEEIEEGQDVMKDFLTYLNDKSREYGKEVGITTNIEQIPGESFAIRLATVDNLIFPDENIIDTPLYANQFSPLWSDEGIYERMDTFGKYDALLSGGGITHLQVGTETTAKQNEQLIRYAVKADCEHFAINRVYSKCEKCGKVYSTKTDVCPECGCDKLGHYTRTIGYFTPVDSWSKVRREWEFPRRKFIDDSLMG